MVDQVTSFKFIEEYQGVPFMEAVQILGQRVGIEVEKPLYSEQKPASPHQALYDMHEDAAKFLSCYSYDNDHGGRG